VSVLEAGALDAAGARYSIITLLMIAIGRRPTCSGIPVCGSRVSFSPQDADLFLGLRIGSVIDSRPVGATALRPAGPAPPPIRSIQIR